MEKIIDHQFCIDENRFLFSAKVIYQPDYNESLLIGTPEKWNCFLSNLFESENYIAYHICNAVLPIDRCNSVTNFKKVWILNNLPKGRSEFQYDTGNERVYLGIIEDRIKDAFFRHYSPMIVLFPANNQIQDDTLYNIFREEAYNFSSGMDSQRIFARLNEICPEVILVCFFLGKGTVNLIVFKNGLSQIIENESVESLYFETDSLFWRKGLITGTIN